MEESLVKY